MVFVAVHAFGRMATDDHTAAHCPDAAQWSHSGDSSSSLNSSAVSASAHRSKRRREARMIASGKLDAAYSRIRALEQELAAYKAVRATDDEVELVARLERLHRA